MGVQLCRRIEALDWDALSRELDEHGFAASQPVLFPDECEDVLSRARVDYDVVSSCYSRTAPGAQSRAHVIGIFHDAR